MLQSERKTDLTQECVEVPFYRQDTNSCDISFDNVTFSSLLEGGREISAIIVTDDYYLSNEEPKSPYKFFLILIFNELFNFKTSDERQH